jgi:hypothetical protein
MNFDQLASSEIVEKTKNALVGKGYGVYIAGTKEEALAQVISLIPAGSTVMHGTSVTLEQIGYVGYLNDGHHGWVDLHARVRGENDPLKRAQARRESVLADYYLGSVHALIANGDFIVASKTGSQLPHIAFTSANLIFVVSTKKIVPDMNMAMKRLEEYIIPLEDKHMQQLYNSHTALNKLLIFQGEVAELKRKIHFVLVTEDLGY